MVIFKERHKLPIAILIIYLSLYMLMLFYGIDYKSGDLYLHMVVFCVGVLLFFLNIQIELKDDNTMRYSLFHFFAKKIDLKSDIARIQFSQISPLKDFGGWGIRFSKKYGLSYIFGSDYIITFYFKNSKKRTFTVKDVYKLKKALDRLGIVYN